MAFIAVLYDCEELRANTITNYLCGINYVLRINNLDHSFMNTSAVNGMKAGLKKEDQFNDNRTQIKLPFTLDMIIKARDELLDLRVIQDHCVYVALLTAFVMILRTSEYLKSPSSLHYLLGECVVFFIQEDNKLKSVSSQYIHYFPWDIVLSVRIVIRSAKNDTSGMAKVRIFNRSEVKDVIDMCKLHYTWCCCARPEPGYPYFGYREWSLSTFILAKVMKASARLLNVDDSRLTSHCLRYGGASALFAADVEAVIIQQVGAWKSTAFLNYMRLSTKVTDRIHNILLSNDGLNAEDVKTMLDFKAKRIKSR